MIAFKVDDMSCGHCVGAITRAVAAVDPAAQLSIELADHRVTINSEAVDAASLRRAIEAAGYTPVLLQTPLTADVAATTAQPRRGCCCR